MKASQIHTASRLLSERLDFIEAIARISAKSDGVRVLIEQVWVEKYRAIFFLQEEIRFIEEQLKTLGVEI